MKLIHKQTQSVIAEKLRCARNPFSRLKGLIGRKNLDEGEALSLIPCNSIHMFGMRFALDILFLDKKGEVLKMIEGIKPFGISPIVWKAHSVVELRTGTIREKSIQIGDVLEMC